MKKLSINRIAPLLAILLTFAHISTIGQEEKPTTKEITKLKYFTENNNLQYLVIESSLKTGTKIEPVRQKTFKIFLDSTSPGMLVSAVTTDEQGKAKCFLPPSLKDAWAGNTQHKFIAMAPGKDEADAEIEVKKCRIEIDTALQDGKRSVTAKVQKYENNEWVPASEVEMKIGFRRLGGILPVGEKDTYTTDSTGAAIAEVNKDSLPGDEHGKLVIVAKVEDNDDYGNLSVEKTVGWGIAEKPDTHFFDQRALWATKFRTPIWLLAMAYSIVIGVWGTIIYLILQIVKIGKLGKQAQLK